MKPPAVDQWVAKGRCPVDRVLQVEGLTGVSRYDLRPDIYGPAPSLDRHPSAVSQAGA
ncbi:YdaS family helix-turn-helix protein [Methylobacterium indicum]|uniref:YdaS family helix-turn-helix protein n=1 Tax=Methylobacterium indicum TaxID=1775910 RepID=UPI001FCB4ECC|nr:YdaS family helix-turn-helix protein [Methylobacterium indicum]